MEHALLLRQLTGEPAASSFLLLYACSTFPTVVVVAVVVVVAGIAELRRPHPQEPHRVSAGGTRHGSAYVPAALRPCRRRRQQLQLQLRPQQQALNMIRAHLSVCVWRWWYPRLKTASSVCRMWRRVIAQKNTRGYPTHVLVYQIWW